MQRNFKCERAWSDFTGAGWNCRWAGSGIERSGLLWFWAVEANTHVSGEREFSPLSSAHMLWSIVLFSDESKFCISFGNQGPRVWRKSGEAQNPCCLKSSVKFPQSVMIWAAMSSAGVGPLCFLKSTVNAAIYQEILEHFMLPQALWRCWFHFPAGLGTCPHCQRYQKLVQWPWCYCAWLASKHAWPEPHRESMGYCQVEDERHQTQQCRWPEGHCQRNLGFHTTSAVPQTDHLHATPNWGSN